LIGTPPNIFVSSFLHSQYHVTIDFWTWLGFGMPLVLAMLPITYWLLTRVNFPIGETRLDVLPDGEEAHWRWARLTPGARATVCVFVAAACAWMTRGLLVNLQLFGQKPFAALSDTAVALAAALALYVFPARSPDGPALTWVDTRDLPWGTLLLFGGGLSLAAAISANHIDSAVGALLAGFPPYPKPVVIAVIAAVVIFVSEIASNIATAAAMTPFLAAAAPALGMTPAEAAIVAGLAASSAYMLPVGTAPNALAYGSGFLSTRDMARTGFSLNIVSIVLIVVVVTYVLPGLL
jgi:sodium-dependent dicarboxylate transporter 2/3/5